MCTPDRGPVFHRAPAGHLAGLGRALIVGYAASGPQACGQKCAQGARARPVPPPLARTDRFPACPAARPRSPRPSRRWRRGLSCSREEPARSGPHTSWGGTAGAPPSAPALPSARPHLGAGSEGLGGCDLNPGNDAEHAASLGSERGDGRPGRAAQAPLAPSRGARGG